VLGHARSTQRHEGGVSDEEERLVARIVTLATRYSQSGCRRITAQLGVERWRVNHKWAERIRGAGRVKGTPKAAPTGRLWLNDGSCIRLRPGRENHVWNYDFMVARTQDGRVLGILTILDEYARECLSITVSRRITSQEVISQLVELFLERGIPEHIRLDNELEFTARVIRQWLRDLGVKTLYIELGSLWRMGTLNG
jgi:putative transposase